MIGTRLAHYEITRHLGTGGMGEVYEAADSKLGRDVAIKFLPEAFTHDAERVARFQREARVLASLNHANIASIYGFEESNGRNFLVMELVPGETLADRIQRGPIPIDEAIAYATQIAEALEAAHEKGVIHRDLKPANVKITPEGKVKVLDFGLAKAFEGEPVSGVASHSPTISMAATQQGIILGTAAYMSPEQAKGRMADRRSDVFSFGCVLYEMLTGHVAFEGEDITEILARVVTSELDWSRLPAETPPAIRRLLRRSLKKDPRQRLGDIRDARLELQEKEEASRATVESQAPAGPARRLPWVLAAILGLGLVAVVVRWAPWTATTPAPAMRLSVELGADASLDSAAGSTLALSPDGTVLVFAGTKTGGRQLYVRRLGQLLSSPLSGTEDGTDPFFSPNGDWIGFFAGGKLRKISVNGGAAVTLADAPNARGGAWGDDDYIAFTPRTLAGVSLMRVLSAGGTAEPLTKLAPDEVVHRWPQVLPGAKAILYTAHNATNGYDDANIVVQQLPGGKPKVVQRGGYHARYLPSGHLVYIHDGTLFAAPFDIDALEIKGAPVPVVEGVTSNTGTGRSQFAVSQKGSLVYVPGVSGGGERPMFWMVRDGTTTPLRPTPSNWSNPQFSPDGSKIAIDILSGAVDVWVYEWARDTLTRFSFDAADDRKPVWTPDSRRITFASNRVDKSAFNLYWQRADGTGEIQRLTDSKEGQIPSSWHPNGKLLAFTQQTVQSSSDIMILPIEGDEASGWKPGKPAVFLGTPNPEAEPMFSPDGRWIAYFSSESGRNEVFVRPFPGPGGKWQISTAGGTYPEWSRARKELLYRALDNRMMVVSYTVDGNSFKADKPKVWSERASELRPRQRMWALHPDGERIMVFAASEDANTVRQDKAVFIFNFFDELRRIALPKK